jgi:hypothetical protein
VYHRLGEQRCLGWRRGFGRLRTGRRGLTAPGGALAGFLKSGVGLACVSACAEGGPSVCDGGAELRERSASSVLRNQPAGVLNHFPAPRVRRAISMPIPSLRAFAVLAGLARCPQCGIAHPNLTRTAATGPISSEAGARAPQIWAVYSCQSCGGGVLVSTDPNNTQRVNAIFPTPKEAHEDIPEPARRFLQQALDTLHAPDAAAVMAGSAVDAMLKHLQLTEGLCTQGSTRPLRPTL